MTRETADLVPLGDAAVLVVLGETVDEAVNDRVQAAAAALDRLHLDDPRFGRPVPAYASVLVPVDPLDPGVERATERLREVLDAAAPGRRRHRRGPLIEIPTRYGGDDGPDLEEVAALHALAPGAVVELHASVEYRAYFLGFAPGFAYLGPVPEAIATPRLPTPRARIPAGSVGIAGEQTAVYPVDSPGGWRIIGRTEIRVWDAGAESPALIQPGSRVRFIPVR